MSELLTLTGMVLSAVPMGEYDKRVVILTKERGKISAFAKGARRPNSSLLAAANPFSFGSFSFYEGRSAYTMVQADVREYFQQVKEDFEAAYYGFYFMEFADYYTRENNDEAQMLNLLYVTLKALANPRIGAKLVRYIFELKAMVINGEYPQVFACMECGCTEHLRAFVPEKNGLLCGECAVHYPRQIQLLDSTIYTLQYIVSAELSKLYTFTVSKEVLNEFIRVQDCFRSLYIDKKFKSLEILEMILKN